MQLVSAVLATIFFKWLLAEEREVEASEVS
jgi:hypothetical protein